MTGTLIRLRLKAMLASFLSRGTSKGKKSGKLQLVLIAALLLYAVGAMTLLFGVGCSYLAEGFHSMGLDWFYFALAGTLALVLALFGSVFSTQNQMFDAKDNELLLSLPIPPGKILFSRLISLMLLNLLFAGIVFFPAMAVHSMTVGFRPYLLLQLLSLLGIVLLAQSLACLLGWGMHWLLGKMNKAAASLLFFVLFLGAYFYCYAKAGEFLNFLLTSGAAIAETTWKYARPLFWLGRGCVGDITSAVVFFLLCAAVFGLSFAILSKGFVRSALNQGRSAKRKHLHLQGAKVRSAAQAIEYKELRRFLTTPVYLLNSGFGLILALILPVAAIFAREKLETLWLLFPEWKSMLPLILAVSTGFTASTNAISCPSVSLEGKSLWVLKSMPLSAKEILVGKLRLHLHLCLPVALISGFCTTLLMGCSLRDALLVCVLAMLEAALNGVLGLVCGLKWAKFDWLNETYPCKQSVALLVAMFGMMFYAFLPLLLSLTKLSAVLILGISIGLTALLLLLFTRLLLTWGCRRWDKL